LTIAEIDADATALASILASLTGAVLVRQRIKYKTAFEADTVASGSAPITRTGIFFFDTGGDLPDALISVPAIKDEMIMSTGTGAGVLIDTSNGYVSSFIAAVIENGISNPFADDIVSFISAYLQSRV
jgi:hypothetical protein